MAPSREESHASDKHDPPLQQLIFSCQVCHATVSELYSRPEPNLNPQTRQEDGLMINLWMASCAHLICSKHLEGGGAPFTPQGVLPEATCPVCVRTKQDKNPKELYAIRGLNEGEYDTAIPVEYFQCPPVRLNAHDRGTDALRFQYSHLVSYAQDVRKNWRVAEKKRHVAEANLHKEHKKYRGLDVELQLLKQRHEETSTRLQKWETRKEAIKHYMDIVSEMTHDIHTMRCKLSQLGYPAPKKTYSFKPGERTMAPGHDTRHRPEEYSSATLVGDRNESSSHGKRKRPDYDAYGEEFQTGQFHDQGVDRSHEVRRSVLPRKPHDKPEQLRPSSRQSFAQSFGAGEWQDRNPQIIPQQLQAREPGFQPQDYYMPSYQATAVDPQDYISPGHEGGSGVGSPLRQGEFFHQPPRRSKHSNQHKPYNNTVRQNYGLPNDDYQVNSSHHGGDSSQTSRHDVPTAYMPARHLPPPTEVYQQRPLNRSHEPAYTMAPSRQAAAASPTASVLSPFFEEPPDSRSNHRKPFPQRGTSPFHRITPPTRDAANTFGRYPTNAAPRTSAPYQSNPNFTTTGDEPLYNKAQRQHPNSNLPQPHRSYQPHSQYPQNHGPRSMLPPAIPSDTRQPLPRPPSSLYGSMTPYRPPTQLHRERLTLPPSRSMRFPLRGVQDPEIARIPGARMAGPASSFQDRPGLGSARYAPFSRGLHSAAGSRTVARR